MLAGPKAANGCPPESDEASSDVPLNPTHQGFPRQVRLNQSRDFDRVFRSATVHRRLGALRLSAVPNRMQTARLGLVVGKRALAEAHERNRAKRVLRETFRRRRGTLPAMDIVVQVTGDASNGAFRASLEALLSQLTPSADEPISRPEK